MLLSDHWIGKVCDFGVVPFEGVPAQAEGHASAHLVGQPARSQYMAPERLVVSATRLFDGKLLNGPAADVYSFGCVLGYMGCGLPPNAHAGLRVNGEPRQVRTSPIAAFVTPELYPQHSDAQARARSAPAAMVDLARACIAEAASERPTFQEVAARLSAPTFKRQISADPTHNFRPAVRLQRGRTPPFSTSAAESVVTAEVEQPSASGLPTAEATMGEATATRGSVEATEELSWCDRCESARAESQGPTGVEMYAVERARRQKLRARGGLLASSSEVPQSPRLESPRLESPRLVPQSPRLVPQSPRLDPLPDPAMTSAPSPSRSDAQQVLSPGYSFI